MHATMEINDANASNLHNNDGRLSHSIQKHRESNATYSWYTTDA
jgi:hypothetical protein